MGLKLIPDEPQLVRNLSKGNLLAFNTLFKEYSGHLYRFAYGYLKSVAESEELVQEVFTIIWEKRANIKEELSFKSFLFTIALNIIRKHFRTKTYLTKYYKTGIIKNEDFDMGTSLNIDRDSLSLYIHELVNKLPERCRKIFLKSRFEDLSIKEISEEFKISHKTVENHLNKALKYL